MVIWTWGVKRKRGSVLMPLLLLGAESNQGIPLSKPGSQDVRQISGDDNKFRSLKEDH